LSLSFLYVTILALLLPQDEPVSIGLLVPDPSYKNIINAAELAIEEGNSRGGYKGRPFKLVIRSTEGPWGAGSKESVGLVYDDDVRAFVGSLDGRNAHLAEQVAAKSHLAYLETRATDPTLSQAYVPWFMRLVPNDDQQARAILSLISEEESGKITILTEENYDTRYAVKSLTKIVARESGISPLILTVNPDETNIKTLIDQIIEAKVDHLVFPFCTTASLEIAAALREHHPDLKMYGTLSFSNGLKSLGGDLKSLDGMILVHSFQGSADQAPVQPEALFSSYTFDGVTLIMNAILKVGSDRQTISDYISDRAHPEGKTGPLLFDELGNRTGNIHFVQILKGEVVPFN